MGSHFLGGWIINALTVPLHGRFAALANRYVDCLSPWLFGQGFGEPGRFDYLLVESTRISEPLPAAEPSPGSADGSHLPAASASAEELIAPPSDSSPDTPKHLKNGSGRTTVQLSLCCLVMPKLRNG